MTQPNPEPSAPPGSLMSGLVAELSNLLKNPGLLATVTGAIYLFLEFNYAMFYSLYFGVSLDEIGLTAAPQLLSKAVLSVTLTVAILILNVASLAIINFAILWLDRLLGLVITTRDVVRAYFQFVVPVVVAALAVSFVWNATTYGQKALKGRGGADILGFQADPVKVVSLTGAPLPAELRERTCIEFLGASSGMDVLFDIQLRQVIHISTNGIGLLGLPRLPNSCATQPATHQ